MNLSDDFTVNLPDVSDLRTAAKHWRAGTVDSETRYAKNPDQLAIDAAKIAAAVAHDAEVKLNTQRAAGRDLKASEARSHTSALNLVDELNSISTECRAATPRLTSDVTPRSRATSATPEYREGEPLREGQSFAGFARHVNRDNFADAEDQPDFGKIIRGIATGDWRDAALEQRVMSGASNGAGGYQIPTLLSGEIIDLARNKARVIEAGARIFPMESRKVMVAKWVTDPTPGWRNENASIATSDGALDVITLTANTLAVLTVVSRELIEDTPVSNELRDAFAQAFALKIDYGALYGSGSAPEPTGVKTNSNVTKTSLATNGATPSWDNLVDAVGRLRDQNEDPTAQIMADRTLRSLAKSKASGSGDYLPAPSYLDGVSRLYTNQIPINETQGTSSDASDVFTADWRQLFIGVRAELSVQVLTERYADTGQIGFLGWWRGDIQVARPKAFDVITGARP